MSAPPTRDDRPAPASEEEHERDERVFAEFLQSATRPRRPAGRRSSAPPTPIETFSLDGDPFGPRG